MVDRMTTSDEAAYAQFRAAEAFMYESLDRMIARLLDGVDETDTIITLVSDHGAKPTGDDFLPGQVLHDAGLVAFKPEAEGADKEEEYIEHLKGRDPHGVVEPEDYEKVRDQIVNALYNYTDPKTGKKPVTLALRREDARYLFMASEYIGDVIYAVSGEFQRQHGGHLGTEQYGEIGDVRSLFIMSGPGVRKGVTIERTIWLQDIVPTLCYLADLPVPRQCEGAIIYQALEDPDMKLNELQSVKRRYEKMRKSLDRAPMC